MDPERWEKVSELFHWACERSPEGRAAFLAVACRDDEELRREVESLLSQEVTIDGPLERVAQEAIGWNSANPRQLPLTVGRYRIRALIGEGGMGAVYEAEQENPRRTVALKVVRSALVIPPAASVRYRLSACAHADASGRVCRCARVVWMWHMSPGGVSCPVRGAGRS